MGTPPTPQITSDYYGTARDPDRTKVDALDRPMTRHDTPGDTRGPSALVKSLAH